jgi:hypothetical protein
MDNRLWDAIHFDAPAWPLHPIFLVVFGDRPVFHLTASLAFFKSLPACDTEGLAKSWAIYVRILEKVASLTSTSAPQPVSRLALGPGSRSVRTQTPGYSLDSSREPITVHCQAPHGSPLLE